MACTIKGSTPKQDGFYFPGEWELQAKCWVGWPFRTDVWPGGAKPAQKAMVDVIAAIAPFEEVNVCVPREHYKAARSAIPEHPNVKVIELSCDDGWLRDIGPTFLRNAAGEVRGVDWRFQAWGGLEEGFYFPWDQDDLAARKICELENVDRYRAPIILEGGAIFGDGEGTVLVTESSELVHNQNKMSKAELEEVLKEYLGAEKVIWLKNGVAYDSVWGHVDLVCSFTRPGEVLLAWSDNKDDENYELMRDNYEILCNEVDAQGRSLKVTKLHLPDPLYFTAKEVASFDAVEDTTCYEAGDRIGASYINYFLGNGCVVVPQFGDERFDARALETFREVFPEREVVGVQARAILMGGGCIHCMTQQQPAVG